MKPLLALLTVYVALFVAPSAHSCPWIGGLPDFNCDGEIIISVLGDSLVYGTLDTENDGKGGYVLRTQRSFQKATFNNFGFPGITTYGLAAKINRAFGRPKPNKLGAQLIKSDLIVLDVGRNDDWSMSPSQTASTLKRLRRHIEDEIKKSNHMRPLVVTAVLMITKTAKKGSWINDLDKLITSSNSKYAPSDLRFDSVPSQLCGTDRIHPTSKGYERLARVFRRYLRTSYPQHVQDLRRDRDTDGLYDGFERTRFGTNPLNPDTDGDGLVDGEDPKPLEP